MKTHQLNNLLIQALMRRNYEVVKSILLKAGDRAKDIIFYKSEYPGQVTPIMLLFSDDTYAKPEKLQILELILAVAGERAIELLNESLGEFTNHKNFIQCAMQKHAWHVADDQMIQLFKFQTLDPTNPENIMEGPMPMSPELQAPSKILQTILKALKGNLNGLIYDKAALISGHTLDEWAEELNLQYEDEEGATLDLSDTDLSDTDSNESSNEVERLELILLGLRNEDTE